MKSPPPLVRLVAMGVALLALGLAGSARAQAPLSETPPGPVGGVPAVLPQIRLPEMSEIEITVPRPVRAAQAAMGLGRQRLALVVGLGTVGNHRVVDSAARDTLAVASALRSGGFIVMQRSDVSAAELRRALQEFRTRLQPGGVGFVYLTGLGAQLDGRNVLLAREATLDPAWPTTTLAAQWRSAAVPLDEVTDALIGPVDSPRLLVVDAAYKHPALAGLPQPGLAEPRLPAGTMALFGHALGEVRDVPFVAPLPIPAPSDAVALAATPFARTLVAALLMPRISGPEALRSTRRALAEATLGQAGPWLGGDTDARDEFAEATLLDGLVPRTPEEMAREGARQVSRLSTRPDAASAGELPVSEVLQQGAKVAPPDETSGKPSDNPAKLPESPGTAGSLGSVAGNAATLLATATGVAATAAGVAATAGTAPAALLGSVATGAAATAATGAVGAATSAVGQAVTPAAGAMPAPAIPTAASGTAPAVTDGRTQRRPDGGERPVFTPRANPYGHAEGDTTTWQVTDTWKGEVTGQYTTAIEQVLDDGRLLANGQRVHLDAQGRVTRRINAEGGVSQFEPAQALWWARPAVGERRIVKYIEKFDRADGTAGQTEWTGNARVGRPRKVETPAGTFEVLPVESSGWWYTRLADGTLRSGQWSRTAYYAPKLGQAVAIEIENADRLGRLMKRERIDLLHAQTARVQP